MATVLMLFSLQVHAMEVVEQQPAMQSIDEISEYCVKLVKKLSEQSKTFSDEDDSFSDEDDYSADWYEGEANSFSDDPFSEEDCLLYKTLPLNDAADRPLCSAFLAKKVSDFDITVHVPNSEGSLGSLRLVWNNKNGESTDFYLSDTDFESLRNKCRDRISAIQYGWDELDQRMYPSDLDVPFENFVVLSRKNLFKKALLFESISISILSTKFGLSELMKARNKVHDKMVYVAIEKDSLNKVKSIFKFITKKESADLLANYLMKLIPHAEGPSSQLPSEIIQKIANKCWDCDES